MNNYCVYLLTHSEHNKTYLGITNNFNRRIRQHNCEIKGGAKYTSNNKQDGIWELKTIVNNLTKSEALSYERTIKNKRRYGRGKTPLERRNFLINLIVKENIIKV